MNIRTIKRSLSVLLVLGATGLGWTGNLYAQGPLRLNTDKVSPPQLTYSNWVNVGITSPFIDGDKGQFSQRHRITSTTFVGIDDLHFEQFVGEDGLLTLGGKAIVANNDYHFRVGFEDPDVGYARTGFRRFSVFYDGSGGFFPVNGVSFAPIGSELSMDRGEMWLEGGLRMESLPQLTLKYSRKIRDGKKPSLAWGDSNLGDPGMRNIAPSYWKSDEVRNIFEGSLEQRLGRNNLGVAVRYEASDINNARNIERRPGETSERYITQNDGSLADLFHVRAFAETRLRKNMLLATSYSFTSLENDLSGNRIYGAGFEPLYDPLYPGRQQRDHGFLDLAGTSRVKHHIGNASLMVQPWAHFTILPSFRVEKQDIEGAIDLIDTDVDRSLNISQHPMSLSNERGLVDLTGKFEARYTGIRRMLLYARGDWVQGSGDLMETEVETETGTVDFQRSSDDSRHTQKYLAGANWYPLRWLNFGVQAYRKHRAISYEHPENPAGVVRYPAFLTSQDFTTDALNLRIRWRPVRGIAFANRYDYQRSDFRADAAELNEIRSAKINRHIFSNTVTWTPLARLYLQGNFAYVLNEMVTPANDLTGAAEDLILESRNDYLNAGATAGFALSQRVDLETQYFFYRADDYVDNSSVSLPYDTGAKEHGLSAGIASQISDRLRWTVRYVYFLSRDEAFGEMNDYDLQMLYSSVQFQF